MEYLLEFCIGPSQKIRGSAQLQVSHRGTPYNGLTLPPSVIMTFCAQLGECNKSPHLSFADITSCFTNWTGLKHLSEAAFKNNVLLLTVVGLRIYSKTIKGHLLETV